MKVSETEGLGHGRSEKKLFFFHLTIRPTSFSSQNLLIIAAEDDKQISETILNWNFTGESTFLHLPKVKHIGSLMPMSIYFLKRDKNYSLHLLNK